MLQVLEKVEDRPTTDLLENTKNSHISDLSESPQNQPHPGPLREHQKATSLVICLKMPNIAIPRICQKIPKIASPQSYQKMPKIASLQTCLKMSK